MIVLVIVLSVVAAAFYAGSDFLEQRAASRASHAGDRDGGAPGPDPDEAVGGGARGQVAARLRSTWHGALATGRRLLHDRVWFAGWAVGTFAYLVQAVALHYGSVSIVQCLQVTSLLFMLPLSTWHRRERVHARDWAGGGAVVGGLALFFVVRGTGSSGAGQADRGRMLFLLAILAGAVVVLTVLAVLRSGPSRAVLLACAAGAALASSASMVKLTTQDLTGVGVVGTAEDWPGYGLALAAIVGATLQQAAFASGKLPTASTAMIVTNPIVGTVFATVAYGEALPTGVLGLGGLALAGALLVLGVWVLSHSPLLRGDDQPGDDRPQAAGTTGGAGHGEAAGPDGTSLAQAAPSA